MKTTTASGRSCATWAVESSPQSTRAEFEIPVPRCGSRIDLDAVGGEPAGELGVERGGERVAGDQQGPERLLRRRWGVDLARVEGIGRDRRDAGAGRGRSRRLVEAAAAEVLVGRETAGERVLGVGERQPVGDPLRGAADGD